MRKYGGGPTTPTTTSVITPGFKKDRGGLCHAISKFPFFTNSTAIDQIHIFG